MHDPKLVEQYSGAGATGYDQRREKTPRFQAEVRAFATLFASVAPDWVIDCPVGSGRWSEQYRTVRGTVVGIDASEAMLREAEKKYRDAGVDVRLVHGSIFDPGVFKANAQPGRGLVASIRFMNWISLAQVRTAIPCLAASKPASLIVGISVRPRAWSLAKRTLARLALARFNLVPALKRMPLPTVHDEASVLAVFASEGWRVVAQEQVFVDASRVNYFYRFEPAEWSA